MPGVVAAAASDGPDGARQMILAGWRGVRLHRAGVSTVRARLTQGEDPNRISLTLFDEAGDIVASIREAVFAEAPDVLGADAIARDRLFRFEWTSVSVSHDVSSGNIALLGAGDASSAGPLGMLSSGVDSYDDLRSLNQAIGDRAPEFVFADFCDASAANEGDELSVRAREVLHRALALIQQWLSDDRYEDSKLVVVTQGAVEAVAGEGVSDLASAPLWGLVRSAQSEHPERLTLIDVDQANISIEELVAAVLSEEPELARRDGSFLVPRVSRLTVNASAEALEPTRPGTVLITGGTGRIGRLMARHLVVEHGIDHLLLVSRSGPRAPGARELEAELTGLGADVQIVACDVTDRDQLKALLDSVPDEHPLTGVVHAAADFANAMVTSLTPELIDRVFEAKVDAALLLDELTQHLDLTMFALCSSLAGALGNPGQGNYAAANVFLDALAARRRSRGLAATSLVWGLWTPHCAAARRRRGRGSGSAASAGYRGVRRDGVGRDACADRSGSGQRGAGGTGGSGRPGCIGRRGPGRPRAAAAVGPVARSKAGSSKWRRSGTRGASLRSGRTSARAPVIALGARAAGSRAGL